MPLLFEAFVVDCTAPLKRERNEKKRSKNEKEREGYDLVRWRMKLIKN